MRLRDGGLVTHGVWAMREDAARTSRDAAARRRARRARGSGDESRQGGAVIVAGVGDRRYLSHFFFEEARNMKYTR